MNYKYILDDVKKNNEKYILQGNIEIGSQFKQWLWGRKDKERRERREGDVRREPCAPQQQSQARDVTGLRGVRCACTWHTHERDV